MNLILNLYLFSLFCIFYLSSVAGVKSNGRGKLLANIEENVRKDASTDLGDGGSQDAKYAKAIAKVKARNRHHNIKLKKPKDEEVRQKNTLADEITVSRRNFHKTKRRKNNENKDIPDYVLGNLATFNKNNNLILDRHLNVTRMSRKKKKKNRRSKRISTLVNGKKPVDIIIHIKMRDPDASAISGP